MKVSVIIPTYKPQSYFADCLMSLSKQTFNKDLFEVVIVLNGCNEPYKTYINEIITSLHFENNIRLLQTEEAGVSNARNLGLDSAKGEFICFIDDDDFVSPTYIEQLFHHAAKEVISLCKPLSFIDGSLDYKPYNITKDYIKQSNKKNVRFLKARRYFNGPVYKLIHREIIGNRRFDVRFKNGEDSLFMFLISDRFSFVEFTDESAIYYRRFRKGSAIENNTDKRYLLSNNINLMKEQSKIYFRHLFKYNFLFYLQMMASRVNIIFKNI